MSFKLDIDEHIIFQVRRSWFVLFEKTIALIFSILIPLILMSFVETTNTIKIGGNKEFFLMILMLSWIFVVWNLIFVVWTDYYLDIFVITNKHLIDIEQKGLFRREVSILNLKNIQDITTDITGLIATIIGFGDLKIQSAGSRREFIIKEINKPEMVRTKIKEAISGEI